MPGCAVKSCKNTFTTKKKLQGITFHQFPVAKEIRDKWTAAVQSSRNDPQWWPSDKSLVCSVHFDENDLYLTNKGFSRVKRCAYPKKMLTSCVTAKNSTLPNNPLTLVMVPGVPDSPELSNATDVEPRIKPDPDTIETTNINMAISNSPQKLVVEIEAICSDTSNTNATSPSTSSSVYRHQNNTNETNVLSSPSEKNFSILHTEAGPVPSCFMTACPKCAHRFWVSASVTQQTGSREKTTKLSNERVVNILSPNVSSAPYNEVAVETARAPAAVPNTSTSVPIVSVKREPIDDGEQDLPSLDTLTTNYKLLQKLQSKNLSLEDNKKKIKTLQQRLRRLQNRNKSLKDEINSIKKHEDVTVVDNIFKHLDRKKLKKNLKYSPDVKKFCVTLNKHYPKAYEYVRNTFNSCLPHPKTLSKWCRSRKDEPGFTEGNLEFVEENLEFVEDELEFAEENLEFTVENEDSE